MFNRLTDAGVHTDERMFATLDPTVRAISLPSRRRALLSDTVGFIRNLPTTLVQAFRATLEEITDAKLILHVVDISSAHAPEHTAHVFKVLTEIGAVEIPHLLVLNKSDLAPGLAVDAEATRMRLLAEPGRSPVRAISISARTGLGLDELLRAIDEHLLFDPLSRARFQISISEGSKISLLHQFGRVFEVSYSGENCEIAAEVPESLKRRLGLL